jgi:hypothetical protein
MVGNTPEVETPKPIEFKQPAIPQEEPVAPIEDPQDMSEKK